MFQDKYKDRSPQETVKIITDFFTNKGMTIKLVHDEQSEINTYSSRIQLYINNTCILGANGKGINRIFSLASAYAELYERFCNQIGYLTNPIFSEQIKNFSFQKNGFYLNADEKLLTYDEIFENPTFKQYFFDLIPDEKILFKYLNIICNEQPIGVPYKNLQNDSIAYFDTKFLHLINGSNGMVAGNSVEEALNQGISEICERYSFDLLVRKPQETYYELSEDAIHNLDLLSIIKTLKEKYCLHIYDLSYNFAMPTVLTVLIDPNTFCIYPSFGSFPIFDIALERCLTELYQGVYSYTSHKYIEKRQKPFNNKKFFDSEILYFNNYSGSPIFFDDIFLHTKKIDTISSLYCQQENATNSDLVSYYKDLLLKLNIDCYYYDNSLTDEMCSLFIAFTNKIVLKSTYLGMKNILSPQSRINCIQNIIYQYNLAKNAINIQNYNLVDFPYNNVSLKEPYSRVFEFLFNRMDIMQPFYLAPVKNISLAAIEIFLQLDNTKIRELLDILEYTPFFKPFKKYLFLKDFSYKYNPQQMLKLSKILQLDITLNDLIEKDNLMYWIKTIYIDTTCTLYKSNEYQQLLQSYIN